MKCKGRGKIPCVTCGSRGLIKCVTCNGGGSLLARNIAIIRWYVNLAVQYYSNLYIIIIDYLELLLTLAGTRCHDFRALVII